MKIAHYMQGIWEPGGIASYIRRVSQAQRDLGHEVVFFDRQAVKVGTAQEWLPRIVESADALYRTALKSGVDILHLHRVIESSPPPELATVRTLHGHEPYCPSGGQFLQRSEKPCGLVYSPMACLRGHLQERCGSVRPRRMLLAFRQTRTERATLNRIPVITVSDFLRERMIRAGYPAKNIRTLHLMAPESPAPHGPSTTEIPHFVFLGRITPLKGAQWLVRAVARVKTPIHVDIAGIGYFENKVRELANELGVQDRITFHGWVDQAKVRALLGDARALVFPSLWHEPGGTVAFEAMVNGRAIIMSRVGGMPEVVEDHIDGLLVEPGDDEALARQLTLLATDPALADRLGQAGRRMAMERFTLKRHAETLIGIYQDIFSKAWPASQDLMQGRPRI